MEILQYRTRRKCYNCNDIPNFALKPKYAIQHTSNTDGYFKVQAGGKVCGVGGGGGHTGPFGGNTERGKEVKRAGWMRYAQCGESSMAWKGRWAGRGGQWRGAMSTHAGRSACKYSGLGDAAMG